MKYKTALYKLIHSLTPEEKRKYKQWRKSKSSQNCQIIILFDTLVKQRKLNENRLRIKLKVNNLHTLVRHLYFEIITCFAQQDDIGTIPNMILSAIFLHSKDQISEAEDILNEAEQMSVENEHFLIVCKIKEIKLRWCKQTPENAQQLLRFSSEILNWNNKYNQLTKIKFLSIELFSQKEAKKVYNTYIKLKNLESKSITATMCQLTSIGKFQLRRSKYNDCILTCEKILEFEFITHDTIAFVQKALRYICISLIELKKYKKARNHLNKLIELKNKKNHIEISMLEIRLLSSMKKYEEAVSIFENTIINHENSTTKELLIYAGFSYLMIGQRE